MSSPVPHVPPEVLPRYPDCDPNLADKIVDVLVIGGGISGLSAAKQAYEGKAEVLVLEARDRVGGRTWTRRDPQYQYCDVGGAYIGPSQNRILRLSSELGLQTYKIFHDGEYIHFSHGKGVRFTGSWPRFWNPFAWLDVNNLFRTFDKMIEEISVTAPWDAPHAEEWDNMTVQQFYDQVCWTAAAKEFGRAFTNANVSMEPSEVSLLWFFWYVKSCGGSKRIWEVDNGGQERKFVGGSGQVSERLALKLGKRVILEQSVNKITQKDGIVHVRSTTGKTYQAKNVILATAPTLHLKIEFDPPLPPIRNQLIQRIPMGSCIKNNVFYKTAFWRTEGFNGFGSAADGIEPVGNFVDDCKPDGSFPALTGFIMGDPARRLARMTREERMKETCECYARIFNNPEALNPVAYEENNWLAEPYSGGCYTSTYPPGVMTRFGRELRKPIGNIHFAGTETATEWTGYMDGAVEAGERAARECLVKLDLLTEDKIYQSEPEFKDIPVRPFDESFLEAMSPSVGQALVSITAVMALSLVGTYVIRRHPDKVTSFFSKTQDMLWLKW